jgi:hypothetical protein
MRATCPAHLILLASAAQQETKDASVNRNYAKRFNLIMSKVALKNLRVEVHVLIHYPETFPQGKIP